MSVAPRVLASIFGALAVGCAAAQPPAPGEAAADGTTPALAEPAPLDERFEIALQALERRDYPTALIWLTILGEQRHRGAELVLARLHLRGEAGAVNAGEAARWYRQAALGDDAGAQNALGELFRDGVGVENDDPEALWWFRKAAEQGLAAGQRNLGLMFCLGRGASSDPVEGAQWLQQAAQQGDAPAQYQLGRRLFEGDGIGRDEDAGRRWLRAAADGGEVAAADYLRMRPAGPAER